MIYIFLLIFEVSGIEGVELGGIESWGWCEGLMDMCYFLSLLFSCWIYVSNLLFVYLKVLGEYSSWSVCFLIFVRLMFLYWW